ncbi:MAG: OmpA family protein [Saprospiraceae bacterium]|nr:OmpA family protein [Saprospiraceae bacterium]
MLRPLLFLFFLLFCLNLQSQSLFDSLYTSYQTEVYFATGKADLSAADGLRLDTLVAQLRAQPMALHIRITAHTDSVGNPAANQALSERRAQTLYKALQQRGLQTTDIDVAGFGENQPAASNDTEEGRQCNRRATLEVIKQVPMATFGGRITDQTTGEGIPDALVLLRSKTRADSTRTDTAGYYKVRLPKDSVVKVEALAPNYFFESVTMRVFGSPDLYEKYKISPDITLPPAKAGEKAILRDFFFVGNQAILLKVSKPELPKVLKFMQINPDLKIEVSGHVNHPNLSPEHLLKWEWDLSENRAKLVYDYLLENGIAAERMTYKGYGNKEMLFPKGGTEAQQQQNRRVEIRVTSSK